MDEQNSVAYEDGVLRIGTVHVAFPGYEVRRTGTVVEGWPHLRPGVEIVSSDQPFTQPIARAVVFAQDEPIAEDPARALLTAHQTVGLVDAPTTLEGVEESAERRCAYSVVEGTIEGTEDVRAVSATVVATGGGAPSVGVNLSSDDRDDLEARIVELAEALCR